MMNANSHFVTLRYPLIMHTILFPYVAHNFGFCSLLELLMMNANSHFVTFRYPLIMHTILFPYVAHNLNNKQNWS